MSGILRRKSFVWSAHLVNLAVPQDYGTKEGTRQKLDVFIVLSIALDSNNVLSLLCSSPGESVATKTLHIRQYSQPIYDFGLSLADAENNIFCGQIIKARKHSVFSSNDKKQHDILAFTRTSKMSI